MRTTITESDESKPVTNASGERVGRVLTVEDGTAQVDPESGLTQTFLSMLGWAETDDESGSYLLKSEAVAEVTDEEITLKEF